MPSMLAPIAAPRLRSALLRSRQYFVLGSALPEKHPASTVSIAIVRASTAEEQSTLVINSRRFGSADFNGRRCARMIRARHFPSSGWNASIRNVLYCIYCPVALVHRRDAKIGRSLVAKTAQFPSPRQLRSDVIGSSLIAGHGSSAESVRRQ
jgi:hypothetical protein